MNTSVSTMVGGVLVGLVAGFPAGILFVTLRKAWADVGSAKKAVPKARRAPGTAPARPYSLPSYWPSRWPPASAPFATAEPAGPGGQR